MLSLFMHFFFIWNKYISFKEFDPFLGYYFIWPFSLFSVRYPSLRTVMLGHILKEQRSLLHLCSVKFGYVACVNSA